MPEPPRRRIDFDQLNMFGKALFVGGETVRLLANAVDGVIERAATMVADAEKAFKQGLDPNIEDAKILEEHEEKPIRKRTKPSS